MSLYSLSLFCSSDSVCQEKKQTTIRQQCVFSPFCCLSNHLLLAAEAALIVRTSSILSSLTKDSCYCIRGSLYSGQYIQRNLYSYDIHQKCPDWTPCLQCLSLEPAQPPLPPVPSLLPVDSQPQACMESHVARDIEQSHAGSYIVLQQKSHREE